MGDGGQVTEKGCGIDDRMSRGQIIKKGNR